MKSVKAFSDNHLKIFIGSDNDGYEIKNRIYVSLGVPSDLLITDIGVESSEIQTDASIITGIISSLVLENIESKGILFCKWGIETSIMANKFDGIRAIVGINTDIAMIGREIYNANILCIPTEILNFESVRDIVRTFIDTKFVNSMESIRKSYIMENLQTQ